ncbi:MAG: AAA family ATPase, partial [Actinomycetota bacterium]|nr:AAA family ATPase [Actinomycetota bacterium]
MLGCPKCGAAGPAGARFCSSCGAALAADPAGSRAPRSQRKSVTIVFTDVTGFTALTERLDPERLRRVMTRYFEEMRAVVERHGGVVEKFIGDAIMAVFGLPRLHEDDAVRAVRAALEMRAVLLRLNDDLEREWGITIRVRTGLDTGEVAVGAAGVDGTLILGDAVNVAARLQQAAAPQEILLGATTYRLVAAAIDAEPLEALSLKGKGDPVPAFRLLGSRRETSVGGRRLDTPMVGRVDEHAELRSLLDRVRTERLCHTVMIVGSAGVGKTRLVAEFVLSVEGDAAVVSGHCPSYGEGITFWPVTEVVKEVAGIEGDDSLDEAQARL